MKTFVKLTLILALGAMVMNGCDEMEEPPGLMNLTGAKISASFDKKQKTMTRQTPEEYKIGLYSLKLIGDPHTPDYTLFYETNLDNARAFNFTSNDQFFDLDGGDSIPEGNYASVEYGILYLQQRVQISSENNGLTWRNMRVYLCEYGDFKRGDVVQYNDQGEFEGWLYGINEKPDFLPATPREYAYKQPPQNNWWMFADKSAEFFGPFGNMAFWNSVPNPYSKQMLLNYNEGEGNTVVLNFNVAETWNFEDKNGDGYFGGQDIDPVTPTNVHMSLPEVYVSFIP